MCHCPEGTFNSAERIADTEAGRHPFGMECALFFIQKQYRNKGLSVALLKAAADYAASKGDTWVEGYPFVIKEGKLPDPFVWTGLYRTFLKAGFTEVTRRSKARPVMRLRVTTEERNVFS